MRNNLLFALTLERHRPKGAPLKTFAKIASMQSIIAEWSFGLQLLGRMIDGIAINEHSDRSHSLVAPAFSIAQATEHGGNARDE